MTASRGTTNRNDRGSAEDRRRRRQWLVDTFRADVDVPKSLIALTSDRYTSIGNSVPFGKGFPACRCYRCGQLLTVDTVSPDRVIPGIEGGTYRRNNIRPACASCQTTTGNQLRTQRMKERRS